MESSGFDCQLLTKDYYYLAMLNPIKIEEYKKSIEHFKEREGMLFLPEYEEIVRFKGDVQTVYLPHNEKMYANKVQYETFLKELLEHKMVIPEGKSCRVTEKGIFWGNTISRELSDLLGFPR